jgi:pimeloyl-ACP methyl ester carboxylesterase
MAAMSRIASFDGTEIAYRDWGSEGTGPPVVLQHGFVVDAQINWVAPGVVDALVAAGRRVIAPDARGHGESDKPHDASFYGEDLMARDLIALLDHVGAPEVDLVGYSMGAVVALLVAAREPRVRRLVVGGIGASAAELGGVDTRLRPPDDVIAALRTSEPEAIEDQLVRSFRSLADAVDADREALAAQASRPHSTPIELQRIEVPTLVIAGDRDLLAQRPQVLASSIPGARLLVVPGDHLGAVGAPEFSEALIEFLAQPDD